MTTATSISIIEKNVSEFNQWLQEISHQLGADDQCSYHALRGTLFALRDNMTPDEAIHFCQQLPLMVRGVYLEGYRKSDAPAKERNRKEFLSEVRKEMDACGCESDAAEAATAVLRVLKSNITDGQFQQARNMMHKDVQQLFPH